MDATIVLKLKEVHICLGKKNLQRELIGPQGHGLQSLNNSNGSASELLGEIAT